MNAENSRFQNLVTGLEVHLCIRFQLESSYNYEVKVPSVVFDLFALIDPTIQDSHPKMNILPAPRQVSVLIFKLIAHKLFELGFRNRIGLL